MTEMTVILVMDVLIVVMMLVVSIFVIYNFIGFVFLLQFYPQPETRRGKNQNNGFKKQFIVSLPPVHLPNSSQLQIRHLEKKKFLT